MVDNLRLLKNFVITMGIVLFLGFFLLIFKAFDKLANEKTTCVESEIEVEGKILDFIPFSDKAIGVVSAQEGGNVVTIYDYCSGAERSKIHFVEIK